VRQSEAKREKYMGDEEAMKHSMASHVILSIELIWFV